MDATIAVASSALINFLFILKPSCFCFVLFGFLFVSGAIIAVLYLKKPYKILLFFSKILLSFRDVDCFQEVFSLFCCQVVYDIGRYEKSSPLFCGIGGRKDVVSRTPPPESEENKQIITYQRSARRKKQARLTCGGSCRNTYAPGICVMSKNPLSERSEFWIFAHAFSRFSEH